MNHEEIIDAHLPPENHMERLATVPYPVHELASNLLRSHTGVEGGCPTIDWYRLRDELASAIAKALDDQRDLDTPPQEHVISDEAVRRAARAIWQTWQEHKKSEASWEDVEKAALQPHDFPKLYEAHALALDEARAALMAAMSAPAPQNRAMGAAPVDGRDET